MNKKNILLGVSCSGRIPAGSRANIRHQLPLKLLQPCIPSFVPSVSRMAGGGRILNTERQFMHTNLTRHTHLDWHRCWAAGGLIGEAKLAELQLCIGMVPFGTCQACLHSRWQPDLKKTPWGFLLWPLPIEAAPNT